MLNIDKLSDAASDYFRAWCNPPKPEHDDAGTVYTNRFTEATRASPYWAAHVDQFVWPAFIVLVIVEVARWV